MTDYGINVTLWEEKHPGWRVSGRRIGRGFVAHRSKDRRQVAGIDLNRLAELAEAADEERGDGS